MKDDLVDALIPVFWATVRPALLPKTRLNRSGWNTSINVRRAPVCNLCSIQTNQAAIAALFRVVNRYVGNLAPMPGVFPDYPAPVIRNTNNGSELAMMRWGMPPPLSTSGIRRHRTGAAGSSQRADAWCRSIALLRARTKP